MSDDGYVKDALEMMGAGYEEQKAAIIERPRTVHGLGDAGLEEYKLFGWVKVSAKFCNHIKTLRGAKLAIWLCLALSIDEDGECKLRIVDLKSMTGYSHTEIIDSLRELAEMGFLSINKDGKSNLYQPVFVAKGAGKTPRVKKLDSTPLDSNESSLALEKIRPTSIKKELRIKRSANAKPETPHEIKLFREVTERYPNKINYPDVISIIQGVCKRLGRDCISEDLRPFYAAWCAKGYKPVNLAWLSWAESGIIPQQAKQQTEQPKGFGAIQQWLQSKQEAYGNAD
jgi:hypothetical protein